MKLATYTLGQRTSIGVVVDDGIHDLVAAVPAVPDDMVAFLAAGPGAMQAARAVASRRRDAIPLHDVRLEAPVLRPRKFLGIGANYPRPDAPGVTGEELMRMKAAGHQIWFNKQVTCINGPYDPVLLPALAEQVIYETELAFVIGERCRRLAAADVPRVIAGYMICNDLTVVDWALRSPAVTLAKSYDTHGPIGPWIVTPDEVGDPQTLGLRTYLNGQQRQNGSTADMAFNCCEQVAYLSQSVTLEPGDIITTGTPARVKDHLQVGDVIRCEIDRIGHIENIVAAE